MSRSQLSQPSGARSAWRLIESAADALRRSIPQGWSVNLEFESVLPSGERPDAVITVKGPGSRRSRWLLVECKTNVTPRVAVEAAQQLKVYLDLNPEATGVVVGPWGSRRTREVLRELGVGFIDPTGNIDLVIDDPGLVVRVEGASENPEGRPAPSPGLRGPKAWALMKTMIEVRPPYGVRELAGAVGTDPGYTSRVVSALEEERLVSRSRRGPITDVDWQALLSQLTTTYSVLDSNKPSTWIARSAVRGLPEKLASADLQIRWAVTGSLGANLLAPVAAPAMAIVYADDPLEVAETLRLLPADSGANVALAQPYDEAAYARSWVVDGVTFVSVAQLAADCLTGTGRMPAEGQALVEWMRDSEGSWRANTLDSSRSPLEL